MGESIEIPEKAIFTFTQARIDQSALVVEADIRNLDPAYAKTVEEDCYFIDGVGENQMAEESMGYGGFEIGPGEVKPLTYTFHYSALGAGNNVNDALMNIHIKNGKFYCTGEFNAIFNIDIPLQPLPTLSAVPENWLPAADEIPKGLTPAAQELATGDELKAKLDENLKNLLDFGLISRTSQKYLPPDGCASDGIREISLTNYLFSTAEGAERAFEDLSWLQNTDFGGRSISVLRGSTNTMSNCQPPDLITITSHLFRRENLLFLISATVKTDGSVDKNQLVDLIANLAGNWEKRVNLPPP